MTNFQKKVATAVATSAMLLNILTPLAHADTTIEVSGNGAFSDSAANVNVSNNTTVTQNNTANVVNNVNSTSNSGGNKANGNTGGDVSVKTGNATTNVSVNNDLNKNVADVNNCNCDADTKVTISGNGFGSNNTANLTQGNNTGVYQNNTANVSNNVTADSNSGDNKANWNTGGDVSIMTGNATTNVSVDTKANVNVAHVGGNGPSNGSSVELIISGNGAWSDNSINLTNNNSVTLTQDNYADVHNNVHADANSGYNKANGNTGGDVEIKTGAAKTDVDVDTDVNFNAADISCDCEMDVKVKIAENGKKSDNNIYANLGSNLSAFQDNDSDLNNYVDGDSNSGDNKAKYNTGDVDHESDPSIMTGESKSSTEVDNSGNMNFYGPGADVHVPGVDVDLHFDFDLSDLLALLGLA